MAEQLFYTTGSKEFIEAFKKHFPTFHMIVNQAMTMKLFLPKLIFNTFLLA